MNNFVKHIGVNFKYIPDHYGYFISKCGKVLSMKYGYPRLLSQNITNTGYYKVTLCRNNNPKTWLTHRLMLLTFKPKTKNECCNHKDGNKLNNNLRNLEWCTFKKSMRHAYDSKLINLPKGEDANNAILTNKEVKEILWELVIQELPGYKIAQMYGVHRGTISNIKHGRSWKSIDI